MAAAGAGSVTPARGGVVEGFYGTPWTWEQRVAHLEWAVPLGLPAYVYAPKDDPKHRARWREPYGPEELEGFRRLLAVPGARVLFAVSPGLSIDVDDEADRVALLGKFEALAAVGVRGFVLAVDDIPPRPGLGAAHAALTAWLRPRLDGDLLLVPTDYTSTTATTYLRALDDGCPDDVAIGWTGRTVVADVITAADARARARSLGGRKPWLWDNYPVNDGLMADRLFLGPLRGRDPDLPGELSGYAANLALQPLASRLPLHSAAAWLHGDDPQLAWAAAADRLGWRVLAEACDGHHPRALVEAWLGSGDEGPLVAWLVAAAEVRAPGLEDEAAGWLAQCRTEAALALTAVRAGGAGGVEVESFLGGVLAPWLRLPRARHVVMGPRRSWRPVLGQDDAGGFVATAAMVEEDRNATDRVVRAVLAHLDG